jgi:sodium-dependent dicarboxylate transporter 2/3/5
LFTAGTAFFGPLLLGPDRWLQAWGMQVAAGRTAGLALLMAALWATEALPIAITALLPLALLPLLGVAASNDVATKYFNDSNLLFLGSLMVAAAVQQCGLHRRIALRVLLAVGTPPRRLLFGVRLG